MPFHTNGLNGITPQRLLDTRDGTGAPAVPLGPGGSLDLQVTGRGGVPASGVSAVVLTVTATQPTASGYVTVWPTGESRSTISNLNFVPGQTVPNTVVVKVGSGGKVSMFNLAGTTHLVADVTGWYAVGSQFVPISPQRLLDTRSGFGGVTGPTSGKVDVQVLGQVGLPTTGVTAVILNVTVTEPTADMYLTVWPTGFTQPVASNLNARRGQTRPNLVFAKVGVGGKISYFSNAGSTHAVIDVFGYVAGPTSLTEALAPVDTNNGYGAFQESTVQFQGNTVPNSIYFSTSFASLCSASVSNWEEYNLGRQWTTFATTLGFDDVKGSAVSNVRFRIFGDDVLLSDQTVGFGKTLAIVVPVAGVLRLRIDLLNANASGTPCSTGPVLVNPVLSTDALSALPDPAEFTPLVPSRILDTRDGTGAGLGAVAPGGVVDLQVTGRGGVPASGVGAVVFDLAVTQPTTAGFITVWPSGPDRPLASSANFVAGDTVASLVIVPVGSNGRVSFFNSAGSTHLVADVLGWFPGTVSTLPSSTSLTAALDPVDTNNAYGAFQESTVQLSGSAALNSIYFSTSFSSLCSTTASNWEEYNLGRHWSTLATTLGFDDVKGSAVSKVRFRIFGDGVLLSDQTVGFGQALPIVVPVAGVLRLRIDLLNANAAGTPCSTGPVLASPTLSR